MDLVGTKNFIMVSPFREKPFPRMYQPCSAV